MSLAQAAPPVDAFGQLPRLKWVKLSPDGTHYAAVQVSKGKEVLAIYNMTGQGEQVRVLNMAGHKKAEEKLENFSWVNNDRIVFSISVATQRGHILTTDTRLISIKKDLTDQRKIPKDKKSANRDGYRDKDSYAQIQDRIISWLPDDPEHILMLYNLDGKGWVNSAYKINVSNGSSQLVEHGSDRLGDYLADLEGNIRVKFEYNNNKEIVSVREHGSTIWKELYSRSEDEGRPFYIDGFSEDPNVLFISTHGNGDTMGLYKYDILERKVVGTVFQDETYAVGNLLRDSVTRKPIGFEYEGHAEVKHYTDPLFSELQGKLEGVFKGATVSITSSDAARSLFVIYVESASRPGEYYLFIRAEGRLMLLGKRYPDLAAEEMAEVTPVSYAARDGMTIPGYLTRPKGAVGPMPLVVLPHGGPSSRDVMRFDYRVQFLASRGYAVLQPNFRGSTGYGSKFKDAGDRQWGLAMQDDITDGVQAMIDRGIADPGKICIVGGSYGGYAALMGAIKTPDLYQCAFAFAPVTDIKQLLKDWARYKFNDRNVPSIGNAWRDGDRLGDTSPVNGVGQIQIPILLIHGDLDRSVPVSHSRNMAKKLKKAGKVHRLIIQEDGDHHHSLEHHRQEYLREMEAFLAEHLH